MRISGLNSGIDTEQMIKDIMTAQRIPVDRVFQQKIQTEWKRDAYRDVNTKLSRFSNFVFDM
ncbi:MAG: flagellar hook protein, partial [Limnochordia bacterium]|nr:flagellar hook protein [Limnochordia bacterium]